MRRSLAMYQTTIEPSRCIRWLVTGTLFLVTVYQTAEAVGTDDPGAAERPRIGLVLGGGGARGAAHIGVLKVLEEMRIPVDYVAGTSMGSIVGGLYASGMSTDDIEREVLAMDWDDLFKDNPTRKQRSFRRKSDDRIYAFEARPGFNDGQIELPLAFIRGQKLDLALNRLMLPIVDVTDFDDLPIPYRAIATDIETGGEVVLGTGSLPKAIRASMAVPAAFDPVEIDGKLLVDGGLANNVPVSVARDMGADIIIAVDVGSGLLKREQITSVFAITGQLANFLFSLNTLQQLESLGPKDVLIIPELGDIGGGSFDRAAETIGPGVDAARKVADALRRYSVSEDEYAHHVAQRGQWQSEPPVIDFVRVENRSRLGDAVIAERITAEVGKPLDLPQLEEDIGQVYGLEVFESVRYDLVREGDETGLVIGATEKHWGPGYLQAGLVSSNNMRGDSTLRLGLLYTRTALNELNGEWRLSGQLGDESGIFTEWHQPLDPLSRYFVSGGFGYLNRNVNVFNSAGDQLARFQLGSFGAQVSAGREFGTWGEGRIGYRRFTGEAELRIGGPLPDIDIDRGEMFFSLSADELDDLNFPSSGYAGKLEWTVARESLGSRVDYDQVFLAYSQAFSWNTNTLVGMLAGGTTLDDNAPLEALFQLGGLFRLSGLQNDQLTGQHVGLLSVSYLRQVQRSTIFQSYLGMSLELGNVWQQSSDIKFDNTIFAGSLFLGMATPIGPVYLAYGRTDTSEDSFYLYIGPRFVF